MERAITDKLLDVFNRLYNCYGARHWWPGETPFEVCVGAVLTQNTAWGNVEKAIKNFGGRLTPEFVLNASYEELTEIIKPSGFFNQKAKYLKAVTNWFLSDKPSDVNEARKQLLAVNGVGRETADSILLYAFDMPTFVVDAYTVRLLGRLNIDLGGGYEAIRKSFMAELPKDENTVYMYNEYHALIVIHGKERCHKKPECAGCPLSDMCTYKGNL